MYLFRNRNPKPGVFKAVNRYTGEVVFVRKVPGKVPLTIEYLDLLTNQPLLFDSCLHTFSEVTPDDVLDYVLAEKEEVIAKHIAKQLGEGVNENSFAVNAASGDKMNHPKKATMEILKAALNSGVVVDITNAIGTLAKDNDNTIQVMALCGFFHEHGLQQLAYECWDLAKDPHDLDNFSSFRKHFKAGQHLAIQAVYRWFTTVALSTPVKAPKYKHGIRGL